MSRRTTSYALPRPLPPQLVELIAQRFRVLGEPMRIRILEYLREGEASVQEIADELDTSQQNVSKHLHVLLAAHIVGRRKQGNLAFYFIADDNVFALCEHVCGSVRRQIDVLDAVVPR